MNAEIDAVVSDSTDVVSIGVTDFIAAVDDSTVALDLLVSIVLSCGAEAKSSFALIVGSGSEEWTKDKWIESAQTNNLKVKVSKNI